MDSSAVPLKLARLAVCFTILLQGVFGQRELNLYVLCLLCKISWKSMLIASCVCVL